MYTCPEENMSLACRRLMTGQRNWIASGDWSVSERELDEDARPIWTTAERDLMNRRVWVGSSPDLGMTSIIPETGGLIEGLVGCGYGGLVEETGDTIPRNWISSSMARAER
jgi:hypothetical protein